MGHSDPNAALLEPGQEVEIIWKFPNKAADVDLALLGWFQCLGFPLCMVREDRRQFGPARSAIRTRL